MTSGYCSNCGRSLQPDFRLCPYCGAPVNSVPVRIQSAANYRLTRRGTVAFIGFSVLILAFSVYIVIIAHDLTALLLGIVLAALPWVFMAIWPRAAGPPAPGPP